MRENEMKYSSVECVEKGLPGGIFIWLISLHELLLFFIILIIYKAQYQANTQLFDVELKYLSLKMGIIYSAVLITSGWALAEALELYRIKKFKYAMKYHLVSLILGFVFVAVKIYDLYEKVIQGKKFGDDTFWTIYWAVNGFHLIHIIIGFFLMGFLYYRLKKHSVIDLNSFSSCGIFWHMCDVIWIMIYSVYYLPLVKV